MIHHQAELDLEDIVVFYNNIKENLGFEVYEEIYDYIQDIKSRPYSFRTETEKIRVCLTKRFHFCIYFLVIEELSKVWIIGVMNAKQDPNRLLRRLSVLNLS
ncbi:type II toxin-antitoxin system RelE/ParE family toxin [Capnocytophaga sp. HP1101]